MSQGFHFDEHLSMIPSLLCDSYEVWPISLLLIYRWVKAFHFDAASLWYRHYCMIAMRSDLYYFIDLHTRRGRAGSTGGSPPWCSASSPPGCCALLYHHYYYYYHHYYYYRGGQLTDASDRSIDRTSSGTSPILSLLSSLLLLLWRQWTDASDRSIDWIGPAGTSPSIITIIIIIIIGEAMDWRHLSIDQLNGTCRYMTTLEVSQVKSSQVFHLTWASLPSLWSLWWW